MFCVSLLYASYVNLLYGKKPSFSFYRSLSFKFIKYVILNNKDLSRSKSVFIKREFFDILNSCDFINYFNCLKD